jgi:hypothetical protein
MKHYAWPKIGQFRNTIRFVKDKIKFAGLDEENKPIYDNLKIMPRLAFVGTVKLHGTNASVCVGKDEIWFQSRKNIISVEKDNAGFVAFAAVICKKYVMERI